MRKFILTIVIFGILAGSFLAPISFGNTNGGENERRTIYEPTNKELVGSYKVRRSFSLNIALAKEPGFYPTGDTGADDTTTTPTTTTEKPELKPNLPECGVDSGPKIVACVAWIFYYVFFWTTQRIAYFAAMFLDYFMFLSLKSAAYVSPFVEEGWKIVRDVTNIAFIVLLIYVAFKIILQMITTETKKMLATVIIVALLINFSLFFSKVVIDSTNILGRIFYSKIEVKHGEQIIPSEGKSVSVAIVEEADPQRIFKVVEDSGSAEEKPGWVSILPTAVGVTVAAIGIGAAIWTGGLSVGLIVPAMESIGVGLAAAGGVGAVIGFTQPTSGLGQVAIGILLILLATGMNVAMIWVFLAVGFLFLWRIIGLWVIMILAPLAFISHAIPGLKKLPYIGWDDWFNKLLGLSFIAPIFAFFLFLILRFLKISSWTGADKILEDPTIGSPLKIAYIIIPFIFLIALLFQAKKITQKLAGEAGIRFARAITAGVGLAAGAAVGGMALAGRRAVGVRAGIAARRARRRARARGAPREEIARAGREARIGELRRAARVRRRVGRAVRPVHTFLKTIAPVKVSVSENLADIANTIRGAKEGKGISASDVRKTLADLGLARRPRRA